MKNEEVKKSYVVRSTDMKDEGALVAMDFFIISSTVSVIRIRV